MLRAPWGEAWPSDPTARAWRRAGSLLGHAARGGLAGGPRARRDKDCARRLTRSIGTKEKGLPEWSFAPVVTAPMAMRGVDLITAVVVLAEIGDLSRFKSARDLMGYLGPVPSESSTGDSVGRGGITKAGNRWVRRVLIEAAWSYRYRARGPYAQGTRGRRAGARAQDRLEGADAADGALPRPHQEGQAADAPERTGNTMHQSAKL